MKKLLRSALCLILSISLLFCLCACGEDTPDPSEPASGSEISGSDEAYSLMDEVGYREKINFPDKKLETALREAMQLPERFDITPMHMSQLMYLDLRGLGITNLDGLQYCASLEVLYLADNEIVYLDALEKLDYLFILDFSGNRVRDVSPILKLENLMFIDPTDNPLENKGLLSGSFDIDKTYVVTETPGVAWE